VPNGFELTGDGPPPKRLNDNAAVPRAGVRCSEVLDDAFIDSHELPD